MNMFKTQVMPIQRSNDTKNVNEEYWEKGNTGIGEMETCGQRETRKRTKSTQ
jgi:hypothetical protein